MASGPARGIGEEELTASSAAQSPLLPRALTSTSCSPCTAAGGLARLLRTLGHGWFPRNTGLSVLVSGWQPVGAAGSARLQPAQNPGDNFATTDSPALPPQVSPEKCRCAVGSILSEGVESPSPELIQLYQKFGFKVFSFPAPSHVVTATFPYTSALSIWLATRRVHPALDAYIKVRHRPGGGFGGWAART